MTPRIGIDVTYADALKVDCVWCTAKAGENCYLPKGQRNVFQKETWLHLARYVVALGAPRPTKEGST